MPSPVAPNHESFEDRLALVVCAVAIAGEPSTASDQLLVITADSAPRWYAMVQDVAPGRGTATGVRIRDVLLAEGHGRIDRCDAHWVLRTGAQGMGLQVNGRFLQRRVLRSGDFIRVGESALVYFDRVVLTSPDSG